METVFNVIRVYRSNFTKLISELSDEEINHVPAYFSNNIIWNYIHIIVSQQILCYKASGLAYKMDEGIIELYRRGTRPTAIVKRDELKEYIELSVKLIDQLEADYNNKIFSRFEIYTTSSGSTISSIESAISYVAAHDALHLGYAMALRRIVKGDKK